MNEALMFFGGTITGFMGALLIGFRINNKQKAKVTQESKLNEEIDRIVAGLKAYVREPKTAAAASTNKNTVAQSSLPPPPPPLRQKHPEDTIDDRLVKAAELTLLQTKFDRATDTYNELELQKLNILKTILTDGFDPLVTIKYNSGYEERRLSTYVADLQKILN